MTEENTNCLRGFKCPSCGQTEAFNIQIKTICRVTDDGTETLGDCEWDDSNFCGCCKCPHIGTVRDFTKPPLPPDPDGQNDDRSMWAGAAINAFIEETGTDLEDAVCDLVADLRHWCDRNGMDWERELARGLGHYEEETTELDPNTDAIDRDLNREGERVRIMVDVDGVCNVGDTGKITEDPYVDTGFFYVEFDAPKGEKNGHPFKPNELETITE